MLIYIKFIFNLYLNYRLILTKNSKVINYLILNILINYQDE